MVGFEEAGDDEWVSNADWDPEFAEDLIGRTLLVGLTYLEHDGSLQDRRQVFGTVESCDPKKGIALREADTDEMFVIAPVLEAIDFGEPGIYRMADRDEEIEDPDFVALITVTRPARH